MKKHDQNKQDEGSSKEKKGKRLSLTLLKMRLPLKVPLWLPSSSHHSLLTMMMTSMFLLQQMSLPSFPVNPAMIPSLILAVPATSVHVVNTSWMKPLPPSRSQFRFISGMHQPFRPPERAHCAISWTLQRALSLPSSLMLCMFQSLLLHSSQSLALLIKINTALFLKMLVAPS